jgi:hypothetical protein
MAAGEQRRKLLRRCSKPLAIFTAQGLELYCRFFQGDDDGAIHDHQSRGGHRVRGPTAPTATPIGWRTTEVSENVRKNGH